jgi:hypothetical protein
MEALIYFRFFNIKKNGNYVVHIVNIPNLLNIIV